MMFCFKSVNLLFLQYKKTAKIDTKKAALSRFFLLRCVKNFSLVLRNNRAQ